MELKPGYKQTEVGVIPEEWDDTPLAQLSAFITKGSTPTTYGFKWEKDGVLFLRSECVSDDGLDLTQSMFISPAAHAVLRRSEVCDGDLLITITGNVGRVILLTGTGTGNVNQHIARVRVTAANVEPQYVFHFLSQPSVRKRFGSITTGQAYPQISLQQVRDARVSLPPLHEQRAIAAVLSDIDALIGVLDRLITKKRDLKQAAMQQLLTGHTRLPGFHGEWEAATLGEVASVSKGTQLHSTESNLSGKFAHLNGGITPSGYTSKSNTMANTIAISEGGNSCGYVQFRTEPYWCGGHCYSVIPNGIENRFLYHALKGQQSAIMGLRVGSGLPNVQKTAILAFKLRYPATEAEQTAIATVLSDMDAEIAALEARRAKTRALKQGMMQELLTGRIRLI